MKNKEKKAPYMPKGWMARFLNLVKRVKLDKINSKTIAQYEIATAPNASKVTSGLRFLNIIDDNGDVVPENFNKLRLEGEEYKNSLKNIIQIAYSDLFSTIEIDKAELVHLLNYFIGKYDYSRPQAKQASILFAYLCKETGITLSGELEKLNKTEPYSTTTSIKTKQTAISTQRQSKERVEKNIASTDKTGSSDDYIISVRGKDINFSLTLKTEEDIEKFKNVVITLLGDRLTKSENNS